MSFTDLMSSGRGPGLIGMLLALLVLAGFGCLFLFAFDSRFAGGGQTIESVIAQQTREIDRLEIASENKRAALARVEATKAAGKELSELRRENNFRKVRSEALKREVAEAESQIELTAANFEKYKDDYRAFVRGNATGQVLERLETSDGRVYKNVTIREVTAIGMQIRHADGFKRIPFEDLDQELQDRFQFDLKQKEEAVAREKAARARHETAVFATREKVAELEAEKRRKEAEAEQEEARRTITLLESRVASLSREIDSLHSAIAAEQYKRISHAPQMRSDLAAKQRALASMKAEIVRLRTSL